MESGLDRTVAKPVLTVRDSKTLVWPNQNLRYQRCNQDVGWLSLPEKLSPLYLDRYYLPVRSKYLVLGGSAQPSVQYPDLSTRRHR